MSKVYSRNFYTNPFRHRRFDNKINQAEVLEEVMEDVEPFLNDRITLIKDYIDEAGDFKPETRIIGFIKEKLNEKLPSFISYFNNLDWYNKNLRYLEIPVQAMVDKNGFEIQFLSSELIEDTFEELEDGFGYVYEHCSQSLPETIDLWADYADLNPSQFPFITHDSILESTYEIFDTIFENFQKNTLSFFDLVISGDIRTELLKVIKPGISEAVKNSVKDYIRVILKEVLLFTLYLFILRYILKKFNSFIKREDVRFLIRSEINDIKGVFVYAEEELGYRGIRIAQIGRKIKSKIFNLKIKCQYKILKIIRKIYCN